MTSRANLSSRPHVSLVETIWTIGHSTRTTEEFLSLLAHYEIAAVADVRSFPGSRKYPQYGKEVLAATLADHGIDYRWFQILGGRRRAALDSPNTAWRNASFRGYADYMATTEFHQGLDELLEFASRSRTALMCAEAVWWRCHRSMVSDALCVRGVKVLHILDTKHSALHPMTSPARIEHGQLTYTLSS
ncbi:DUF488 domain-containing protein [Candidimonas sp. SYP-B2681]|uniref:DUF488 domain-containing protein n=1 Tax=Candidimonas sp. SYP-B2681 TaxID=2497686 RepID=UPI000F891489|nr:DUF488 domain-containing protein [Candidimonas sp. SYP-B2681]RTZ47674.1 DUF488 domain-containing protein [Candidimonas sp. SYP-B2681]